MSRDFLKVGDVLTEAEFEALFEFEEVPDESQEDVTG